MSKASFTVTIERPPAEVLAYVADLRHMPDWSPGADSVELISGHEPGEVGARFLVTAKHMIEDDVVMDCETTAIELEQLVAFAVRHPTLTGTDTYHLSPAGVGTKLTFTTDFTYTGLNKLLVAPFGTPIIKAITTGLGDKLKAQIER